MKKIVYLFIGFLLIFTVSLFSKDFEWGKLELRSTTQYKLQWSDNPNNLVSNDDNDQDISEILGVDAYHKKTGLSFNFFGKYTKDLDGTPEGSIFEDYVDTNDSRQKLYAYYMYLEKDNFIGNLDLKIGRQYSYSSEIVHYDGVSVSGNGFGKDWFNFEVFGGRIVEMYSNLDRNSVGGFNVELNFIKNLSFYVDTVFYKKNSYEIGAYWKPTDYIKSKVSYAAINSHSRFWSFDISGTCPKTDTTIEVNVFKRFRITIDDDFLYDYTSSIDENIGKDIRRFYLARLIGYIEYSISLSQPIPKQEGMSFFVRYTRRDVNDSTDIFYEKLYNTDFYRWTLGYSIDNWKMLKGFKLNLGYSYWKEENKDFYDASSESFFADVEQEIAKKFIFTAGFYYKTEDVNSMIEGEASHYYYGALKYKFTKENWAQIKYEYETDDYYDEFGVDGVNALTLSLHFVW